MKMKKHGYKRIGEETIIEWWTGPKDVPLDINVTPAYYGGPGRDYTKPAVVTIRGSRILVTQENGIDI